MRRFRITSGQKNRLPQTNLKATISYGGDVHAASPPQVRRLRLSSGKDWGAIQRGSGGPWMGSISVSGPDRHRKEKYW
eukprot:3465621-Pyramimonas_sp.AAC.1